MKKSDEVTIAGIAKDIEYIKVEITEIKESLKVDYVTQKEFAPIKSLVYGMVGIILVAVVGALVALVVIPIKR